MAKKAAKVAPEAPGAEPEKTKGISTAKAVRDAIAKGIESPAEIVGYLKSQFGIDTTKQMVSSYKSKLKARNNAGTEQGATSKHEPEHRPKASSSVRKSTVNGDGDLLDALASMKPLIAQFGAEKVKKMVDLLE